MDRDDPLFRALCKRHGADSRLIAALVTVESGWNPWVCRYEPGYIYTVRHRDFAKALRQSVMTERNQQQTSWGLMQVMGGTARELGFDDLLPKLLLPEFGLEWGIKCWLRTAARYEELENQIAAYNAGSPKRDPFTGQLRNQAYVDKVLAAY